ncbi:MAG: alpha/beta hydrolase [Thermobacillus sp. ZCTH02-B1]|uniref:alpha/beta hydrolase n=1 Tax=Thermobacillus sp. ZCTH02-B1 TaxID=1858795 RepID=UPI000B551FF2|nr:alpha/beta fold hydrolase [Thermobacillus sp. ZCTH02-B1]OUM94831.1 MAG: alpha/beta hydrolase [Thermobacillus sp. ZCTH02-B1]
MRSTVMHPEAGIPAGNPAALPGPALLPGSGPAGGPGLPVLPGGPPARPGAPAASGRRRRLKFAIALASLTALALLAFTALHAYVAWRLAYPPVAPLASNPFEAKGLPYSDFRIPASDGVPAVNGWHIPAPSGGTRTIVFSHGYGTNREEPWVPMYDLAEAMHVMDYNVILFDYGFASAEDRAPATGGVTESRQLVRVIEYAAEAGADRIVVWGFSMGAGTALQAAFLTDDIAAMILDSTFIAEPDTLALNLAQLSPVDGFPRPALVEKFFPLWAGTRLAGIPADRIKRTAYDMPILLIHGTDDEKAPVAIAEAIAASQRHPQSAVWIVPGGRHELMFRTHTGEYLRRVAAFLAGIG